MNLRLPVRSAALGLILVFATTARTTAETVAAAPGSAVVVELFTSQGCSTCPPADALLRKLAAEPGAQSHLVILGYHVDYWNQIGWTDPYSSATWSERQTAYSKSLPAGENYTPQTVVNGRRLCVGSDEPALRQLIAEAAARPSAHLELHLQRSGSKINADIVAAPPAGSMAKLDLMYAVIESGMDTAVKYGENAHKTLRDDFVVRRLGRAFMLQGAEHRDSLSVRLGHGWVPEHTQIAIFLQDPETHEIFGGASAAVPQ
ncbi:MAG: DUF1223 domain-containing protein [Acidobacteriota bacterium]